MPDLPPEPTESRGRSGSISTTMLDRLKHRDGEAWKGLVALLGPVVYSWCRTRGLREADAADVTQDVFQAVAGGLPGFDRDNPGSTFRGWVWRITQNKIHDHFRRRHDEPDAYGGTDAHQRFQQLADTGDPSSEEPSTRDANRMIVRQALRLIRGEFAETTWQAFWRTAVEGRFSAEVAADLGITKEAVRQAKCRVLRRLREMVAWLWSLEGGKGTLMSSGG